MKAILKSQIETLPVSARNERLTGDARSRAITTMPRMKTDAATRKSGTAESAGDRVMGSLVSKYRTEKKIRVIAIT